MFPGFRFCFLFCCAVALSVGCTKSKPVTSTVAEKPDLEIDPDESCELAYQVLFLEEDLGFTSTPEVWGKLDQILDLTPSYAYHDSLSADAKQELLAQFETHLNDQRKLIDEYHNVLSICLQWGIYDCDINSILFYSWGQRWDIPIDIHLFPKHMSVSLPSNDGAIFWETTLNKSVGIEYYRKRYKFDASNEIYNRALSAQEIQAVAYFNVAKEYYDRDYHYRGMVLLEYVNEVFPEWELPCDLMNGLDIVGDEC